MFSPPSEFELYDNSSTKIRISEIKTVNNYIYWDWVVVVDWVDDEFEDWLPNEPTVLVTTTIIV